MKLRNNPEYSTLSGGQAIELAASRADNPDQYKFTVPLLHYKNCNFSFSGIKAQLIRHVISEEKEQGIVKNSVTTKQFFFSSQWKYPFRIKIVFLILNIVCNQ